MFRLTRISKWPTQLQKSLILREATRSTTAFANNSVQTKDGRMTLSEGIFGHLSEASVICNVGGSVVHAALNAARSSDPTDPFLPLTVDYRARQYAFGVIPGSKQRREAHNSTDEILVSRFIDRAIRPLFPKGYVNEVQLTVTNHAADGLHDPTVAAVNAASFALMQSRQPWQGPIGCVRVGCIDGKLKVDPSLKEMENSTLDFLYAGTASRTLMIETAANQVPESVIKDAMKLAHSAVQDIIEAQNKYVEQKAATTAPSVPPVSSESESDVVVADVNAKRQPFIVPPELKSAVKAMIYDEALAMYAAGGSTKEARGKNEGKLRADTLKRLAEDEVWGKEHIITRKMAVEAVMNNAFRSVLLRGDNRIDGRTLSQMRQITAAAPVMPSVHGSSYFTRGDTHVMSSVTLGSKKDCHEVLPIGGGSSGDIVPNYFMLHYDFPPYCTGELGNATSLNRRMVGHGKLAERAVRPVLPSVDDFPYTVRVYSECTSSNGSSSMASACGASLALMDAGVPLKAAVAGMSVGLITHENLGTLLPLLHHNPSLKAEDGSKPYVLLKDILGTEDHNGDMDFKIAGTSEGITAIQLDVKLEGGVPLFMLEEALDVAREGRLEILNTMNQTISKSNAEVKPNAPKAVLIKYDEDRRGMLAGPGGEMLRYMQELYQCTITIDNDQPGLAYIFGKDAKLVAEAESLVRDIAVQVKDGDVLQAQVLAIMDYGLMMKINRAQEAVLHMSDISYDEKLLKTPLDKLFQVGQRFPVQVYSSEKATGLIKVSRKLLCDPKAPSDKIEVIPASQQKQLEPVPTFPVLPPRKYSREYFAHSVSTEEENKQAMRKYENILNPVVSEAPPASAAAPVASSKSDASNNNRVPRSNPPGVARFGKSERVAGGNRSGGEVRQEHRTQSSQRNDRHNKQQYGATRQTPASQSVNNNRTHLAKAENVNQMNKFATALQATKTSNLRTRVPLETYIAEKEAKTAAAAASPEAAPAVATNQSRSTTSATTATPAIPATAVSNVIKTSSPPSQAPVKSDQDHIADINRLIQILYGKSVPGTSSSVSFTSSFSSTVKAAPVAEANVTPAPVSVPEIVPVDTVSKAKADGVLSSGDVVSSSDVSSVSSTDSIVPDKKKKIHKRKNVKPASSVTTTADVQEIAESKKEPSPTSIENVMAAVESSESDKKEEQKKKPKKRSKKTGKTPADATEGREPSVASVTSDSTTASTDSAAPKIKRKKKTTKKKDDSSVSAGSEESAPAVV